MGFLDTIFSNHISTTIDIETYTQSFVNGSFGPYVWAKTKDFKGIFWRGAMAERYVSEQYRSEVDGIVIARPSDVSNTDIPEGARLKIDGQYYSVIYSNNVAGQNK
jgi:hypothetical protein